METKIKVKIRALEILSTGAGQVLHPGEEAEIERTQNDIDRAIALGLYEVVETLPIHPTTPNAVGQPVVQKQKVAGGNN